MLCPECNAEVVTRTENETFLYGVSDAVELSATVQVHRCAKCHFEFTGPEADDARENAINQHLQKFKP